MATSTDTSTATSTGPRVNDALVDACSGSLGSVIALIATFPLKNIYTYQALAAGNSTVSLSVLDVIKKYRLSGLYVGIEPNIVESAVSNGVYFYLYAWLRNLAVKHRKQKLASAGPLAPQQPTSSSSGSSKDQDIGLLASILVPAIAGVGNQLVTMPLSVIATRMQAAKKARADGHAKKSAAMGSIVRDIYHEGGLGGFWAGLVPSLVLISNPTIQYMLYEQLLRLLRAWKRHRLQAQMAQQQQQPPSPVQAQQAQQAEAEAAAAPQGETGPVNSLQPAGIDNIPAVNGTGALAAHPAPPVLPPIKVSAAETFLASALAKIGATLATYWLVVVKSRMQAAGKSMPPELQYKGTVDALRRIWQDEGPGGFFKGLRAKLLQTALNAALMLMLKEQVYLWTRKVLTSGDLQRRAQQLIKV